jgi:1,4-dihydroxy-2-naphthoate polyprenyltransferase
MKKWISAMRLRTLPLAASCILAGSAAAWYAGQGSASVLILALVTTFLLQILSNLANDYGDFTKGTDNADRVGPTRALQSGAITKDAMKRALVICTALALIFGIALLYVALASKGKFYYALGFLVLGLLAIAAAFKYTVGNNPYGYRGLGDLFVFLFFGVVGVGGTYFLHTGDSSFTIFPLAITVGLLSAAVLNLNNLRDHVNDAACGKRTLVVQLGFAKGKIYHLTIVMIAFLSGYAWIAFIAHRAIAWIALFPLLIQLLLLRKVINTTTPAALDPELKKVALLTFLFSLALFISALVS